MPLNVRVDSPSNPLIDVWVPGMSIRIELPSCVPVKVSAGYPLSRTVPASPLPDLDQVMNFPPDPPGVVLHMKPIPLGVPDANGVCDAADEPDDPHPPRQIAAATAAPHMTHGTLDLFM